jgi:hypothetical protein
MAITINGSGTITGISAGGLPDGVITADDLASGVGGKVLQVVSTTKTDAFSVSVGSAAFSGEITGLTATITPSSTSSKILVTVDVRGSESATGAYVNYYLRKNGSVLQAATGGVSSSRPRVTATGWGDNNTGGMSSTTFSFLDSPSTTSSTTYGVGFYNQGGSTNTYHVNRTSSDPDTRIGQRAISTITLMEIGA